MLLQNLKIFREFVVFPLVYQNPRAWNDKDVTNINVAIVCFMSGWLKGIKQQQRHRF